MPRRKKVMKESVENKKQESTSYLSLLFGALTVFVLIGIVLIGIKFIPKLQKTQTDNIANVGASTPLTQKNSDNSQKTYTVSSGDNLWMIAEKEYGSGYNWIDIAKANNLSNPGVINAGNVLVIPSVSKKLATAEVMGASTVSNDPPTVSNKISGSSYTIEKGDTLWSIAERAYNDGYKWVDIAKANNLSNPGVIFSENVLVIPR